MSAAVQLALFGIEGSPRPREPSRQFARYPSSPGYKMPGASQEAAMRVAGDASKLRKAVLEELRRWPAGRTADELAAGLRRSALSVRPRISELKAEGKIVATGERRRGESGLSMSVRTVA